ncbi:sulfonate transport system ATP-binding protein [Peribacillus deserti]|uniref:Sulfonate transport system ATP-binding protein n=1 Tax=Peribacillus deserti TaxID=673318 RepID=A0ABS2QLR1_9BACI|nr:ATP-binding cassette domain-containing protein [Peribacillus deserti]MBM7693398.1 sulfonate transport system ATP-binding protein [Peribacillus deserti]
MESQRFEAHISLRNVKKTYNNRPVLDGINLTIGRGEFIAVVGKSGCGKSTLLRILAGLETSDEGSILINGNPLKGINQDARIMFQDGRLLPWKKVIDNVRIGLKGEWEQESFRALENVDLMDRADEWPGKLSGGQKQRVALARALVHKPEVLLFDEPLGALDALTRLEMQKLIENIWKEHKYTSVLVTHDVEEAVAISDRVILIENGRIALNQEISLPRPRLRTHPAFTEYVEDILNRILYLKSEKDMHLIVNKKKKRVF